jgi:hypothetical protein
MSIQSVLLPLFVEVGLTFVLLFWMGAARREALASGKTATRNVALREPAWPERVMQVSNAYLNQFELPVLFYVLTLLALMTRHADLLFVLMAWLFVILRIAHAGIHTTSNDVSRRFLAFGAGALVLLVMWVIFAVRILVSLA